MSYSGRRLPAAPRSLAARYLTDTGGLGCYSGRHLFSRVSHSGEGLGETAKDCEVGVKGDALHADLTMLARLGQALSRAREVVPQAA